MLACDKRVLCVGRVMCRQAVLLWLNGFLSPVKVGEAPQSLENLIHGFTVWEDVGNWKIYGEKLLVLDVSKCAGSFRLKPV